MSDFTFAEHGEDLLIHRLLLWKECGFYVDCGAYDARKMSLTARLRNFGWTGINVDIDREVIQCLQQSLPSTVSVCAAIGEAEGEATLYRYQDPVINTIDPDQHRHLQAIAQRGELFTQFVGEETVRTTSIACILDENHVPDLQVNFLNLDVEGVELTALQGFPWGRQQPQVVAVEIHRLDLATCAQHPLIYFMYERDYILQSYVFHMAIFTPKTFDTELCHRVPAQRL